MGLLLSVLVACVGVVELITFYHNVTRTVPSYRSAPTNLNRGYVRELKDVRKTIYSDLRKIESGKDVDINNVSYRTELHNKLLSYSENYEDLQGEPVSKLTINQEPNESSSSTRFTNIPEEETGTTFPSHLKYEVHKVHSSFTSTNFSNDHKDFVHLPLPDEICDTKNEAPSSSSWHDQNEDPTRRSPSPFPQLPVPRNSLCNELDDDVVIYDQPSLAYIQHDSKDYWTTSKTLDDSCNISLHKGQYNRDVTTDLQDSNQQNNHVSTNLPFVDRNQHTPPNSKEQCTHLVFSDLLYANKELFAPVKQNICYVTTDVIYDNNQKNNHIPHLDKEHSNEPKDNRLTTNLPFVNKDNHIPCDISGNFNEQQSDHISNLPFVDRVDFYVNPVIADVSCDNHLPTNLPYPNEETVSVNFNDQNNHHVIADTPKLFTSSENDFPEDFNDPNNDLNTDLPLTNQETNFIESKNQLVETDLHFSIKENIPTVFNEQTSYVTADLLLVSKENALGVFVEEQKSHALLTDVPHIDKNIFVDSVERNNQQVTTDLPLTLNRSNVPMTILESGSRDVDTSYVSTVNGILGDSNEQKINSVTTDLPSVNIESNVPVEASEHKNHITFVSTEDNSVDYIKENSHPVVIGLPLVNNNSEILADYDEQKFQIVIPKDIFTDSIKQNSHLIAANLPLTNNNENNVQLEPIEQMINGTADVSSIGTKNNFSVDMIEQNSHPIAVDLPLTKNECNVPIEHENDNVIADATSINTLNVSVASIKQNIQIITDLPLAKIDETNVLAETVTNGIAYMPSDNIENISVVNKEQSSHPITANLPLATNSDNDPVETVRQVTNGIADVPSGSIENNISVVIKEQSIHPITTDLPLAKNENNVPIETVEQGTNIIADVSSINTENVSVDSTKQSSHPITANLPLATNSDNDPVETVGQMTNDIADVPCGSIENNISVVIKEQSSHLIATDLPLVKYENHVPIETVEQGTNIADVPSINTENVSVDSIKHSTQPITGSLPLDGDNDNVLIETVGQTTNRIANVSYDSTEKNISVDLNEQNSQLTDLPLTRNENNVQVETVEQETSVIADVPSINKETILVDSIKQSSHPITANLPLATNSGNDLVETVGELTNSIVDVPSDSTDNFTSVHEQNFHPITVDLPSTKIGNKVPEENVIVDVPYVNTENSIAVDIEIHKNTSINTDLPLVNNENVWLESVEQKSHHDVTSATTVDLVDSSIQENQHTFMNLPLVNKKIILADSGEQVIELIDDVPYISTQDSISGNTDEQNNHRLGVDEPLANNENNIPVVYCEEKIQVDDSCVSTGNNNDVDHQNSHPIAADLPLANKNVSLENGEQQCYGIADMPLVSTENITDLEQKGHFITADLPLVNNDNNFIKENNHNVIVDVYGVSAENKIPVNINEQNSYPITTDLPSINNANPIEIVDEKNYVIADAPGVSTENIPTDLEEKSHPITADLPSPNDKTVSLRTGEQQSNVIADIPVVSTEKISADLKENNHPITADLPLVNNENNFMEETNHQVIATLSCVSAENNSSVNNSEENSRSITTDLPLVNNENISVEIVGEKSNYVIVDVPDVSKKSIFEDHEQTNLPITADLLLVNDENAPLENAEQKCHVIADIPLANTENILEDLKQKSHLITTDLPLVNNENRTTVEIVEEKSNQVTTNVPSVSAESNVVDPNEQSIHLITTDLPNNEHDISAVSVEEKKDNVISDISCVSTVHIINEQYFCPITTDLPLSSDKNNVPVETSEEKNHVVDVPSVSTENNIPVDSNKQNHFITHDLPLVKENKKNSIADESSVGLENTMPLNANEQYHSSISTDLPLANNVPVVCNEEKIHPIIASVPCLSTETNINPDPSEQNSCPIITDLPLVNVPVADFGEQEIHHVSIETKTPVDFNGQISHVTADLPLVSEENVQVHFGEQNAHVIADVTGVSVENILVDSNEQISQLVNIGLPLIYKENVSMVVSDETQESHDVVADVVCVETKNDIAVEFSKISNDTSELLLVKGDEVPVCRVEEEKRVSVDLHLVNNVPIDSNLQESEHVIADLPLVNNNNYLPMDSKEQISDQVSTDVCINAEKDIFVDSEEKISNVSSDLPLINNVPMSFNKKDSDPTDIPLVSPVNNDIIDDLPLVNNENNALVDCNEQISNQNIVCSRTESGFIVDSSEKSSDVVRDLPLINNGSLEFNASDLTVNNELPLVSKVTAEQKNNDILNDLPLVNFECNASNEPISNRVSTDVALSEVASVEANEKNTDLPFVKENVQVVFDERNNYEVIQSNLDVSEGKISLTDSELEFEDALEDNGSFDEHLLDNLDGIKHKIRSDKKSYKKKNIGSSCLETATASMPLAFSNDHTTDEPKVASDGSGKSNSSTSHNDDTGSKEPEPFWLIFSGEYTKAMNKDWHGQHFCCWQCDESLTGQRYVLRDDHPYCVSCYESVFANACEKCSRTIGIDSKDLSYKDKHWHEACFLCTTCGESLVDKQFGSKGDRIYCGSCYDQQFASRCDGCHEIFRAGTKKMEYKTRQWHEKCFCCCVCKTPIGTQSFIPREQEIYCAKCYEDKFATRCIKCNKVITSGGVTYKNEPWHRECFTCTHCQKSLAGERFTSRDEKPYCADCFGELFAKRCTACNKPITGIGGTKFISFEDRHWHNDCFYCAMCRTSLVGRGFITDNEDIICPECAKQKLM